MSQLQIFAFLLFIVGISLIFVSIISKKNIYKLNKLFKYQKYFQNVFVVSIIVLSIYAYFIRPLTPEGVIYNGEVIRSFNETNLVELSWYLTNVGLLLAIIGAILLVYKKPYSEAYFFLGIALIYSVFYIYDSRGSPGHLYIIRYYMTAIIPSLILFISYILISIYSIDRKKNGHYGKIISVALLIFLLFSFVNTDKIIANHIDYDGVIDQTTILSKYFEDDDVILFKNAKYYDVWISTPLRYIHGLNTFIVSPNNIDESFEKMLRIWHDEGRDVYFVDRPPNVIELKSFVFVPKTSFAIDVPWLNNYGDHLPDRISRANHTFIVYKLEDLNSS